MEITPVEATLLVPALAAGFTALGWFGRQWWTRDERLLDSVVKLRQAGLELTAEEQQLVAEAKRRLLRAKIEPSIVQANKMMEAAIALVASVKSEIKDGAKPDLKEIQRLVEMLLNQVVSARFEARWHFEWIRRLDMQLQDGEDARYYLMAAMNDADLLKTLKYMRLIDAPIIESDEREITAFEQSVDLSRLEQKYNEAAKVIPGITEQHRKDFHDKLDYIRNPLRKD